MALLLMKARFGTAQGGTYPAESPLQSGVQVTRLMILDVVPAGIAKTRCNMSAGGN